jgi:hypothetical protein
MKSIRIIYDHQTDMPQELNWLKKYLLKIDIHQLEIHRGVYFLCRHDMVQYVGKTINVLSRLSQHMKEKDFDTVFFLPVWADEKMLEDIEFRFIDFFDPPLNRTKNRSWMFNAESIEEALEKAGIKIKLDLSVKERIDARQKDILAERERALQNFTDKTLFGEIRQECNRIFGYSQWLGSRRWSDIKKRATDIMKDDSDIFSEFYGYRLAAKLALLENRKEEFEKWIGEVKDIRDLEHRKELLKSEIERLDKQKEIKKYWDSKDKPDLIA